MDRRSAVERSGKSFISFVVRLGFDFFLRAGFASNRAGPTTIRGERFLPKIISERRRFALMRLVPRLVTFFLRVPTSCAA
jgi:hypothetical protein